MITMYIKYILLSMVLGSLILSPTVSEAKKKQDTLQRPAPRFKNVIKFNPTPMLLWSKNNATLSYERFIHRNQTAAISVGYLEFGKLFTDDNILNLVEITSRKKGGVNICLEYRFYPFTRNPRPVPDGLYFGPYASFYGYWFENGLEIKNTTLLNNGKFNANFYIVNVGFELGYQFVFWKRITLDLVLAGPAVSYYGGKGILSGNINTEEAEKLNTEFFNALREQYPFLGNLSKKIEFDQNGKLDLFSLGFRYLIQIGFHF